MAAGIPATTSERIQAYAATFGSLAGAPVELTDALDDIINAVSEQIELYLRNYLLKAERVYQPAIVRRYARMVDLTHAPIDTGATVEVRQASDRDFADAATIIDATSYWVDAPKGVILFDEALIGGAGTLQITTTGGLATPDTDALETAYPGIVLAATMWSAEVFRRRRTATKVTVGGRGGTGVTYEPMTAMPRQVMEQLRPYRRGRFAA